MTTPAKPRISAIPTPGRVSGIPTPGRSRSNSSVYQSTPITPSEDISRAFADALKANDPSHHRTLPIATSTSGASLSPQSGAYPLTGRRSVAGRPSSVASTSSVKVQERAKTPTSSRTTSRPPSRQSDAASRLPKSFEAGDNVRIESLGFEGTLRYVGEIDGKPGLWAGVELGGGFAGKGKNNGTVAGKQYFSCPDKCGVFVATTKLSPPTVGPGAIQRPSSVASSRGGRITPAVTGRTTPSSFFSTSRTPSSSFKTPVHGGRVTPSSTAGRTTPGTHLAGKRVLKTPVSKPIDTPLSDKITAGSRASKYMTMTAQQLSSRATGNGADSPTRKSTGGLGMTMSSPTISRTLSSPSRPSGSPFTTPKAGSGKLTSIAGSGSSPAMPSTRGRPSMSTPRARIPSAVAMPPPPPPSPPKLTHTQQILASTSRDSTSSPFSSLDDARSRGQNSSRPSSSTSFRSAGTDELSLVEQLQSRLDALEYENERLRSGSAAEVKDDSSVRIEQLQLEKQQAIDRTREAEEKLAELGRDIGTRNDRLQVLEKQNQELTAALADAKDEVDKLASSHEQESDAHGKALQLLQDQLDETSRLDHQKDAVIEGQSSDIMELKSKLEKAYTDWDDEKKELGSHIDELRIAGQETIALYEERLSDADSQRYELEQRVASLEASITAMGNNDGSQEPASQATSSATLIDNETLRDQVQHLQKKASKLEDQLEDARAALDRDVSAYQDKIGRIRQEEEQRKRDHAAKTREVEQLLKSEAHARNRVEEIEEALRESTVALENARGEVESMRAELTNLDVLIDDTSEGDITSRLATFIKRASSERVRYQQEVAVLEDKLREARTHFSADKKTEDEELNNQIFHLQERVTNLIQALEERTNEVETLRKKVNRDAPLANGDARTTPSKSESSAVREVAGLKHIVQELQKENLTSAQRIKVLESENQLLAAEAEQLRQEVQILEEGMNDTFHEGSGGGESASSNTNDRHAKEQHIRFERELDQIRKRLTETEMKHARIVHDLNKEISELEALVESKIYREDELEQEVERLKEKLSRHKKSSKNASDSLHRLSTASTSTVNSEISAVGTKNEELCEICERPGHDIFNCSLLKEDVGMAGKEEFCEDCESAGHSAADCPHSQDVF